MQLTPEERRKFSAWLRHDVASDRVLIAQMDAMPGLGPLVRKRRLEAGAKLIVADILDATEDQTLAPKDTENARGDAEAQP